MFNSYIKKIVPYQPGQSIASIRDQYQLDDIIKLASNENPLGPAINYPNLTVPIEFYPDYNTHPLIQALSEKHQLSPEQFILGNGSDEILQIIALACLSPGDEVLSSACTFSEYRFVAHITGADYIEAPMRDYHYDVNQMIQCITKKTKLIFIANPNNPTGTIIRQQEFQTLMAKVPSDCLVILDEAYQEYVSDPNYPKSIELLNQYPNVFITRTFSKIYGLAALRVGYGMANTDVMAMIQRVRQPFNVNGIALSAAYEALKQESFVKQSLTMNKKGKDYLLSELSRLDCVIPESHANFLYIDFKDLDGKHIAEHLLKRGVIVRHMGSFGQNQAIRVTIGTEKQNQRFIEELHQCLNHSL